MHQILINIKGSGSHIIELDSTIAATFQTEPELEAEVCNADNYQLALDECITEFIEKASQLTVAPVHTLLPSTAHDYLPTLGSLTGSGEEVTSSTDNSVILMMCES